MLNKWVFSLDTKTKFVSLMLFLGTRLTVSGGFLWLSKKQGSPTRQGTVKRGTPTRRGTVNYSSPTRRGTGKTWFPDASGYRESWYPDASYLDLDQSEQQDCLLLLWLVQINHDASGYLVLRFPDASRNLVFLIIIGTLHWLYCDYVLWYFV